MRATVRTALLAASLLLASCSDDPTKPSGSVSELHYDATFDFFNASTWSLWGTPNGDMVASGDFIMRYDGNGWHPLELPPYDRGFPLTWGASNGDLYAVGSNSIHRYDGSQWHEIQRPASVADAWGSADGHIFVVGGYNRRLYHYDGAAWSVDSLIVPNYRFDDPWRHITGTSSSDVYIAGWDGWLGHYDGHGWTTMRPDSTKSWSSIWKAMDGPLYLTSYDSLYTYDGDGLHPVYLGDRLWDVNVSGQSASEVYCSGGSGRIFSYDGLTWEEVADLDSYTDVFWAERATNRMFAGTTGVIWKIEGGIATPSLGSTQEREQRFEDLWASDDGVYLIGTHAYRYLNGAWTDLKKHELTTQRATSIWGRSGREIYAVGPRMILHYDGEQWTWVSGAGDSWLLAVAGADRVVYAVGEAGTILQLRDGRWSRMESGTTYYLSAVYAWDDRAFAGGQQGAMMYFNGREWRPFSSPVNWNIYDMVGFGDEIFAVGADQTEICRFDGKTWKPIFIEFVPGYCTSIWGTSARNLFIGKSEGHVLHFNGNDWSFLPRVMNSSLSSVCATKDGEVITVGSSVVRYTH